GESQPSLVDLQGSGHLDIVFGDSDGYVHAVDPVTGRELPGWPVHTDPVDVVRGHAGVDAGYEPIISSVAVGDLDHQGDLEVVATSSSGKVYIFGSSGDQRAGWPKVLDAGAVSPQIPRPDLPYTRLPVQGASAPPVLYDLAGDGRLDIIQAGSNGYLQAWSPDGRSLPGWPVNASLPGSYPLDPGYKLVNDSNLVATPAIAYLSGHSGPCVVERLQETEVTGGGVQPAPHGFVTAFGANGSLLSGWPINTNGLIEYYGSAQQQITEGTDSPITADVLGQGSDQVADGPVFSPTFLLNGAGLVVSSYGSSSSALGQLASVIAANGAAASNPTADEPVGFGTSGAFGNFAGSLSMVQAGTGAQSLAAATQFSGSGNPIYNYLRAYGAQSGLARTGFPSLSQGLSFLGAPLVADVTGDGQADIVASGDSSAVEAYTSAGGQAPGFPKFDGGWSVWSPSAGDLLSNGRTDLVMLT
ncbi:MAG: FG-GAP repeat domain-containing protein, partial [Acidimicrobiales bacterium]